MRASLSSPSIVIGACLRYQARGDGTADPTAEREIEQGRWLRRMPGVGREKPLCEADKSFVNNGRAVIWDTGRTPVSISAGEVCW